MLPDLRYGFRVLARSPGFTAAAVTALALGVGANAAMFSVVYSVLLRPLPFRASGKLVAVWEKSRQPRQDRVFVSPANFMDWRSQTAAFSGMAALLDTEANLGGAGEPEQLRAQRVTPELFELLGVRPAVGRVFRPGEDHERVALLSDRLWKRRFGGDRTVAGRGITLNGGNWTVVGVLPPEYQLINRDVDLWIPLPLQPPDTYRTTGARNLMVVARLKPDATVERAQAEMDAVAGRLERAWPQLNSGWGVYVLPLYEEMVGDVRRGIALMLAAVAFLLLIACVNVANLLLAQSAGRRKEMALRMALGASPGRLARQLFCESLLLAAGGGALGVLVAAGGIRLFTALGPKDLPRLDSVELNLAVLAFTVAASFVTAVLFGVAPVVALARPGLAESLKESSRGASPGRRHGLLRDVLAGLEVGLAALLLAGSGLMVRSFVKLRAVDPGLQVERLLTMKVLLPQRAASPAERVEFFRQALERIRAVPGVRAAGAVNVLPLTGFGAAATFTVEGRPAGSVAQKPTALARAVDTDYFRAAGIPLLAGRAFTAGDGAEGPRVVLVSRALARRFWSTPAAALGARVVMDLQPPSTAEVVGVVGDVHTDSLYAEPWPVLYCPHGQLPSTSMTLVVRTGPEPLGMAGAVIREIRVLRPDLPVAEVRTMEEVLARSLAAPRFSAVMLAAFAVVALLLATVGIYGVISCNVAARTHEIGIRMALGARRRDVIRMVTARAAALAGGGIVLGMLAALGLSRLLSGLLYGVAAQDAATFLAIPCLLMAVAVIAGYLPARRAASVNPLDALRRE